MIGKQNQHFVYKRNYEEKSANLFKQKLHETTWDNINNLKELNEACRKILEIFTCKQKSFFSKKENQSKTKKLTEPLGNQKETNTL